MELLELITTFQDLGFECEEQLSKRKKNKFESNKEYHYYFKKGEKIISVFKERDCCSPELCPIQGYKIRCYGKIIIFMTEKPYCIFLG